MAIAVNLHDADPWVNNTHHDVTFASAPATGELMLAFISYAGGDPGTITSPSGWANIAALYDVPNFGHFIGTYYKIAGASESTTQQWSYTNSVFPVVSAHVTLTGVDTTTPIEVSVAWTQLGNFSGTGPFTVASMTTLTNTAWDMVIVNERDDGPGYACSTSGYTEQVDADGFGIYTKEIATAGATGTRSVTINAGFNCDVFNLSIKPGAAPESPGSPHFAFRRRQMRPAAFKPGNAR